MAPFSPTVNLGEIREHQLAQYLSATKLNALLDGFVELMQTRIVDPLETLDRIADIRNQSGFLLDWIGFRLGIVRPRVTDPNQTFFGLEGTEDEGGRPLGQAPFWTRDLSATALQPLGDALFRLLLFARARKLRGDLGLEAWYDCFDILTEISGTIEIVNVGTLSVEILSVDLPPSMKEVIENPAISQQFLPMVPGVEYLFEESVNAGTLRFTLQPSRPSARTV